MPEVLSMPDQSVDTKIALEFVKYPEQAADEFAKVSSSVFKLVWHTSFPPASISASKINSLFSPDKISEKIAAKSRTARFSGIIAVTDARNNRAAVGAGWVVEDITGGWSDRRRPRRAVPPIRLEMLGVPRRYQGRGIGSLVLMELLSSFDDDQHITASVPRDNQSAIRWFGRRGFSYSRDSGPAENFQCAAMRSTVALAQSAIIGDLSTRNGGRLPAYNSRVYTPPPRNFRERMSDLVPEPPDFLTKFKL